MVNSGFGGFWNCFWCCFCDLSEGSSLCRKRIRLNHSVLSRLRSVHFILKTSKTYHTLLNHYLYLAYWIKIHLFTVSNLTFSLQVYSRTQKSITLPSVLASSSFSKSNFPLWFSLEYLRNNLFHLLKVYYTHILFKPHFFSSLSSSLIVSLSCLLMLLTLASFSFLFLAFICSSLSPVSLFFASSLCLLSKVRNVRRWFFLVQNVLQTLFRLEKIGWRLF